MREGAVRRGIRIIGKGFVGIDGIRRVFGLDSLKLKNIILGSRFSFFNFWWLVRIMV